MPGCGCGVPFTVSDPAVIATVARFLTFPTPATTHTYTERTLITFVTCRWLLVVTRLLLHTRLRNVWCGYYPDVVLPYPDYTHRYALFPTCVAGALGRYDLIASRLLHRPTAIPATLHALFVLPHTLTFNDVGRWIHLFTICWLLVDVIHCLCGWTNLLHTLPTGIALDRLPTLQLANPLWCVGCADLPCRLRCVTAPPDGLTACYITFGCGGYAVIVVDLLLITAPHYFRFPLPLTPSRLIVDVPLLLYGWCGCWIPVGWITAFTHTITGYARTFPDLPHYLRCVPIAICIVDSAPLIYCLPPPVVPRLRYPHGVRVAGSFLIYTLLL